MTAGEAHYVLVVWRGPSLLAAAEYLRRNPHPPWSSPSGALPPIAACSGPFRIERKARDWIPADEEWRVLAHHDGPEHRRPR
jgi:hypothetical protein